MVLLSWMCFPYQRCNPCFLNSCKRVILLESDDRSLISWISLSPIPNIDHKNCSSGKMINNWSNEVMSLSVGRYAKAFSISLASLIPIPDIPIPLRNLQNGLDFDFLISSITQSGPLSNISLVWCQSPYSYNNLTLFIAPSIKGSPSLYKFVKILSWSLSPPKDFFTPPVCKPVENFLIPKTFFR